MLADECQQRQGNDQCDDARKNEDVDRIETHGAEGVDFLSHLHGAQFGGVGAAGAAGDHDRDDQHADFAQHKDADHIDHVFVGAELAKMKEALLGDDAADQERNEKDDRRPGHTRIWLVPWRWRSKLVLRRPIPFRLTSAVHHLDRVAWQAVPIILLITFLIGSIITQQGSFHFRKFGADEYVVDMVGILVLREIGVLIVAIMVAGRPGSSYTAELGSMKMREEIDALRTMGLDPVEILLLPRVIALVIALPLLTFLGSMAALYGGGLVAWVYWRYGPRDLHGSPEGSDLADAFQGRPHQGPFHGLGDRHRRFAEGLKVKGSAELLGLQTTASVVKSIFLVIALDGLFAIFFASIGM